ncbi:hypothetical protein [Caldilinea sp.]|uniref:hypothetical protein n=1 Tax=Caldilinea sp. TaxID=2293560 RepID=UPI0021DD33F8|nr:hypothetical protein [Caldilinea sp.]GIV70858.1 MAG: hypothetical protein KatS3mg048_3720 [Caldilinea sp.]
MFAYQQLQVQRRKWMFWMLFLTISLVLSGCQLPGWSSPPAPAQPVQPQPLQQPVPQQLPPQQPLPQQLPLQQPVPQQLPLQQPLPQQQPFPQQRQAFNLVGVWESQIPTEYGTMYTQMILQHNGSYSYQVVLGNLMTWEVGVYQAGEGFIHFTLQDYGPREYMGREMARPMSWSVFYTVVDENTMIWEDRVLGARWTVYRQG